MLRPNTVDWLGFWVCRKVLPESIGVEARAVSELAVTAAGKARLVRVGAA